jgi:flagellar biosynthesis chaperone FliJ
LEATIEDEQAALADERAALEETHEQLTDIANRLGESTPEEVEDLLDEIETEELDGQSLNAINDATEAAAEGDMATAEDLVTKAAENAEAAIREIDVSDEKIKRQLELLEEAREALDNEDVEEALSLIQEV